MSENNPSWPVYGLALADGSRWAISSVDEPSASLVKQLGTALRLEPAAQPAGLPVLIDVNNPQHPGRLGQIMSLSQAIIEQIQASGGVLLHAALAEWKECGVILAGPSGRGKSTTSLRLPSPWRSLSDDVALVVRDDQGRYWAHPWPTWRFFRDRDPAGRWDVQHAVPLRALFILAQSPVNRVEIIGPGHAVSLLIESARQAAQHIEYGLEVEHKHLLRLQRFDNLCDLVKTLPVGALHLNLTGPFWHEIERIIKPVEPESEGAG